MFGGDSGPLTTQANALFGPAEFRKKVNHLLHSSPDTDSLAFAELTPGGAADLLQAAVDLHTAAKAATPADKTEIDKYYNDAGTEEKMDKTSTEWRDSAENFAGMTIKVLEKAADALVQDPTATIPRVTQLTELLKKAQAVSGMSQSAIDPTYKKLHDWKEQKNGPAVSQQQPTQSKPAITGIPPEEIQQINHLVQNRTQPIPPTASKTERNAVQFLRSAYGLFPSGTRIILADGLEVTV